MACESRNELCLIRWLIKPLLLLLVRACGHGSHPSAPVHLTRLVVLWSLLNLPFAALLIPLSHYTSSSSPKA